MKKMKKFDVFEKKMVTNSKKNIILVMLSLSLDEVIYPDDKYDSIIEQMRWNVEKIERTIS